MAEILGTKRAGFPFETADPFLFCVHHDDAYPRGNAQMGPDASLAGRRLGQDFEGKDGWRMYHGRAVPGFPSHPHRGFETVTVARRGFIDHADSLGATARYGEGDVQWMTAGRGIVHAEMFPLLHGDRDNRCELFQIWLNLPASSKMVEPHFSMLWSPSIPRATFSDAEGRKTDVTVIAGALGPLVPPTPPPASWASNPDADVAIWTLTMAPGATFELPAARPGTNRTLYLVRGGGLEVAGRQFLHALGLALQPDRPAQLRALPGPETELLLLQARPIGEPVVQHGPFVMNTVAEIQQAYRDYQTTGFGGWPWPNEAPVHPRDAGRFAKHVGGRVEWPG
jgi:redox-sensitive bicupin YhaK (pirin superfamily)